MRCDDCGIIVSGQMSIRAHHKVCPRGRRAMRATQPRRVYAPSDVVVPADAIDFYGILDASGSMAGDPMLGAKRAVADVFDKMNEYDRIALVSFDTTVRMVLPPQPVGKIRRKGEMPQLMGRIYPGGGTALYDAVWQAVDQIHDKTKRTVMIVVTDGEDNASTHTKDQLMQHIAEYPAVSVNIVHVSKDGVADPAYKEICEGRGVYCVERTHVNLQPIVMRIYVEYIQVVRTIAAPASTASMIN